MSNVHDSCLQCSRLIGNNNRLITDNCGHKKCRQCFIEDESRCLQCATGSLGDDDLSENIVFSESRTQENPVAPGDMKKLEQKRCPKRKVSVLPKDHIQKKTTTEGRSYYHCMICDKSFGSRTQQYYHEFCGNNEKKKYHCEHCEKGFSSRSHLNYHSESHSTDMYNCYICSKVFTRLSIYKRHEKMHQNIGDNCVRPTATTKSKLIKPNIDHFACELCHKEYKRRSTLRQHMQQHSEKKYLCGYCNKKFQRNSTLLLHTKRHLLVNNHNCSDCSKVFKDRAALLRHKKTHLDLVKYKCKECNITSTRKDNIFRHIRNMHNRENVEGFIEALCKNAKEHDAIEVLQGAIGEVASNATIEAACPKTVENSSVIKCVGKVTPVRVPSDSEQFMHDTIMITKDNDRNMDIVADKTDTKNAITHKKLRPKYDPIEMYRKILNSDEIPTLSPIMERNRAELTEVIKPSTDPRSVQNPSNFSEMHWRKNFKYTYEYQYY